jgi:hypothetical protein
MSQAATLLQTLLEGVAQAALFPRVNLLACQPISTLSKFNSSPPIKQLKSLFSDSQLDPRIGFNQVCKKAKVLNAKGSGDISITVTLPLTEQPCSSPQQAVLWFLLGLYHNQQETEELYARQVKPEGIVGTDFRQPGDLLLAVFLPLTGHSCTPRSPLLEFPLCSAPCSPLSTLHYPFSLFPLYLLCSVIYYYAFLTKSGGELLINRCLSLFMDQTQIAFTSRKKDFRLNFMTLRLDSYQKKITQKDGTLYTDNMAVPYRYSPNYW